MTDQPDSFGERIDRLIDQASENERRLTNVIGRVAEALARTLELVNRQRYDTNRH